ncbi:MAG TPA: FISUMP domain-containing protein, partial [Bacteroidales bacterium]|nr:FISUMP domain-containing protein [Bacteroidales bacterium]
SITTCVSNNPATSNSVTMVVDPLIPVSISVAPSQNNVCQGTPVTFTATPSPLAGNHHYQWTVNGINSGADQNTFIYSPNNNDVVACTLNVSGLSCLTNNPKTSQPVTMIVNPQLTPVVTLSALPVPPVCGNISVTFTAHPVNGGITPAYQWFVNGNPAGTGLTYSFIPANNDLVVCTMNSSAQCPTVNPVTSIPFQVPVITPPVVTYTLCTDSITTLNAKPFKLKGGLPLGGIYSGPGVNSSNSLFTPSIAGVGTKTISYSYTNAGLCSDAKTKNIIVRAPAAFTCGNSFTDIRDNKIYKTIQIGSQCWFAENLNYGREITSNQHQRDNCLSEKYSTHTSPLTSHSFYQWDELMQYTETPGDKGLCPPGWHVPTEPEWQTLFNFYAGIAFAGAPLKSTGFSGFNAAPLGSSHQNTGFNYAGFATFFWTSTAYGSYKAWAHGMNETDPSASTYPSSRANAFSVRCVRD